MVTKLFILHGGNMSEDQIKKFNQFVERVIRQNGTCKIEHETQGVACFEADDTYGFVGWWDNDHSQMTYADTPYQVYCDMP